MARTPLDGRCSRKLKLALNLRASFSIAPIALIASAASACAMLVPSAQATQNAGSDATAPPSLVTAPGSESPARPGQLTSIRAGWSAAGQRTSTTRALASTKTMAAVPQAPFTECPAVGLDTSCGVLIDVTESGAQVLLDPSQGPYDGGDDTLVGVLNQSSKTLNSLSLGSETDIFGFDGDGICSYGVAAGCPFGLSGYEGPGASFTGISPDFESGVVNFAGGIAPGSAAYFSLEEPLAGSSSITATSSSSSATYVALGDSYSSGEGLGGSKGQYWIDRSKWTNKKCDRSSLGYPALVQIPGAGGHTYYEEQSSTYSWAFLACSGDDAKKVEKQQLTTKLGAQTKLVTITVGGDDHELFTKTLEYCSLNWNCSTASYGQTTFAQYLEGKIASVRGEVAKVYERIRQLAPGAKIAVLGYPLLFPESTAKQECGELRQRTINPGLHWSVGFSPDEQNFLNKETRKLNGELAAAVSEAKAGDIQFISVEALFAHHAICGSQGAWINGPNVRHEGWKLTIDASFHPTAQGQEAYAEVVNLLYADQYTAGTVGMAARVLSRALTSTAPRAFNAATATATTSTEPQAYGQIAGVVKPAAGGTQLKSVLACAYEYASGEYGGCAETGENGEYTIAGLAAGEYTVVFTAPEANYLPQYWNGKASWSEAEPVAVAPGSTVTGIDAEMQAGGEIAGTVTAASGGPVEKAEVCAYQAASESGSGCVETGSTGEYAIMGLPSGEYKVEFSVPGGDFQSQYYSGRSSWAEAQSVSVTAGTTVPTVNAELQSGGEIAGTVTDAASKAQIKGVAVCAYQASSGAAVGCAETDEAGEYAIPGLMTGEYMIQFTAHEGGYLPQYYSGKSSWSEAEVVSVTAGAATNGIGAEMRAGGEIAGSVSAASDGAALKGMVACAYDAATDGYAGCAETGETGEYAIVGLAAGEYKVQFTGPGGDYLTQYYSGKASLAEAEVVSVTAGTPTTAIDASMVEGGKIAGVVTAASSGAQLGGATVCAYSASSGDYAGCAETGETGGYTISSLPSGEYKVKFADAQGGYLPLYYSGGSSWNEAQAVSVIVGSAATEVSASLVQGGEIAGTVTAASSGAALEGVQVCAYAASTAARASCVTTDEAGQYSISGLATGEYKVDFTAGETCGPNGCAQSAYLSQYWSGKSSWFEAESVSVGVGGVVPGVDARMVEGGRISGIVTNAAGSGIEAVEVCAYEYSSRALSACAPTGSAGEYTIGGLPSGEYKVEFAAYEGNYLPQYYNGKSAWTEAESVTVQAGVTTPGIDASMAQGGSISGTVAVGATGAALEGVKVCAFSVSSDRETGCVWSGAGGEYVIPALATGSYKVAFLPGRATGYAYQYYNGKPSLEAAEEVAVTEGQTTAAIDAKLIELGSIAGTVTVASNGSAIEGVVVCAYDAVGEPAGCEHTNSGGEYTIRDLEPGAYKVQFLPVEVNGNGYLGQYYNGKRTLEEAELVTVEAAQTTSAIDAGMVELGRIAGRVTNVKGEPVANISVTVYDSTAGNAVAYAQTNEQGEYVVRNLTPGSYRVQFAPGYACTEAGCALQSYLTQYYNGKSNWGEAEVVAVQAERTTENIDETMVEGGRIAGKVSDAKGEALANVSVVAYDADGSTVAYAVSGEAGEYTLTGLPTGAYKVQFSPYCSESSCYLTQYYSGKSSFEEAEPVSVEAEHTVEGIDATMRLSSAITGKVTNASGEPLPNVEVSVFAAGVSYPYEVAYAWPGESGQYTVTGLQPGSYKVEFSQPYCYGSGCYVTQYYNDKRTLEEAEPVSVETEQTAEGIDATMRGPGAISGRVTNVKGEPVAGASVTVYEAATDIAVGYTTSGEAGEYKVDNLASGSYKVQFSPGYTCSETCQWQNYVTQYYNGKRSLEEAEPVSVEAEHTVEGIDATMLASSAIAGKVTNASGEPLANVEVTVFAAGGSHPYEIGYAWTGESGQYTVTGLQAGTYEVEFSQPYCYGSGCYLTQYYNGKSSFEEADTLILEAEQTAENIDATMYTSGSIAGKVTNAKGEPVDGASVAVYDSVGAVVSYATTDEAGEYTAAGLAAGSYRVQFAPGYKCTETGCTPQDYVTQYYNGKRSLGEADAIELAGGEAKTGIDATMQAGSQIAGTVTGSEGKPAAGVRVAVFDVLNRNWIAETSTNEAGEYTIAGLAPGSYKLQFSSGYTCTASGCTWQSYLTQYYNGKSSLGEADAVELGAEEAKSGIDAAMLTAGSISGRVTNERGEPVEGVNVTIYDASGGYPVSWTSTGPNGEYAVAYLSGSYKIQFSPGYACTETGCTSQNYLTQYFSVKDTLEEADVVSTEPGKPAEGIDATMAEGGQIAGKVTNAAGEAVEGALVGALTATGEDPQIVSYGPTTANGEYVIAGLPAGEYKVGFLPPRPSDYAFQYYNNVTTWAQATPVPVQLGKTLEGIDAVLGEGGRISGTVTGQSGAPLEGATVCAYEYGTGLHASLWCIETDPEGKYAIEGLASGSYRVEFSDAGRYATQYYNGKATAEEANEVIVEAGKTTEGVNAALSPTNSISGKVTNANGEPAANVNVTILQTTYGYPSPVGYIATGENGEYIVYGLAHGSYKVEFSPGYTCTEAGCTEQDYVRQFYNGKANIEEADTVQLSANESVAGIDAVMQLGGRITGKIANAAGEPVAGVNISVVTDSGESAGWAQSDEHGEYAVGGLKPGSYKVQFSPGYTCTDTGCQTQNYLTQYYNGKRTLEEADTLTLEAGQTLEGIDATLSEGGQIAGAVKNAAGEPLMGVQVLAFEAGGAQGALVGYAVTNEHGEYSIAGLAPGSYKVQFSIEEANGVAYATQYYNGKPSLEQADPVGVTAGEATTGIDATMLPPGPAAPANTELPAISGEALEGQTLTEMPGKWEGAPTSFAYQWLRCEAGSTSSGALTALTSGTLTSCTPISGATGQTYTLGAEDVGHQIEVQETATNEGGPATATSSATAAVLPLAPSNTSAPTIEGEARQGKLLKERHGSWEPPASVSPLSYSYQWLRCDSSGAGCTPISGAKEQSYFVKAEDAGHTIRVEETATNAGGSGKPATSAQTGEVLPQAPVNTAPPTVAGEAREGQTLQEQHGAWTNNPTAYVYAWLRCDGSGAGCTPISGATSQSYTLTAADVGHTIEAQETATNAGGSSAAATSAHTAEVLPQAPSNTAVPTIEGEARQGAALSERHGNWTPTASVSPISYAYQWQDCDSSGNGCSAISGATASTYTVGPKDAGHTIRVQETAANAGGSATASSAATAEVKSIAGIAGAVTDSQGNPLNGAKVTVLEATGAQGYVASASTGEHGEYTIAGLAAGEYKVEIAAAGYVTQTFTQAVSSGATAEVNAKLVAATGAIAGAVSASGKTLTGVKITVYDSAGKVAGSATSSASGAYEISGLAPVAAAQGYRVQFSATGYETQFYNGRKTLKEAEAVAVVAGQTTGSVDAQMQASTGAIAGQVTNAGGEPLGGVQIVLYRQASGGWLFAGLATTSAAGSAHPGAYEVSGLVPGSYRVEFSGEGLRTQFYNGTAAGTETFTEASVVSVVKGAMSSVGATMQAATGEIEGKLTDASGAALAGVEVLAYEAGAEGVFVSSATTDSNGHYTIAGLSGGSYLLQFSAHGYVTQFYSGKASLLEAEPVSVTAGSATNAGATMRLATGSIAGTVTDEANAPLEGVRVTVLASGGYVTSEMTGANGEYKIAGLSEGEYKLEFSAGGYVTQFYSGKASQSEAEPVGVQAEKAVSNVDATMSILTGSLEGKLTNSSGSVLAGMQVIAYEATGEHLFAGFAVTNAEGQYKISGLTSGSYYVEFSSSRTEYVTQFYSEQSSIASAGTVSVTAPVATTGVDATLKTKAQIKAAALVSGLGAVRPNAASTTTGGIAGTVSDARIGKALAGVEVIAYEGEGDHLFAGYAVTDASGAYSITGLGEGSYKVEFRDSGYEKQFYNGQSSLSEADPVSVTVGTTHTGVDAALKSAGIAGTVTGAGGGELVSAAAVTVYDRNGAVVGTATTGEHGAYVVSGLPAGEYKLEFSANGYATQFYNGQSSLATANAVMLVEGQEGHANVSLTATAGSIAGKVTDAKAVELVGATVRVYNASGQIVATVKTEAGSGYRVNGLAPARYRVEFSDSGYESQFYNGAKTLTSATAVEVSSGQTQSGVDGALTATAGAISGEVTAGGKALAKASVTVYELSGKVVATTETDANGHYLVSGLKEGSYDVEFSASGYEAQFYNDKSTLEVAETVSVTAGSTHEGVSAALVATAGAISGTVIDGGSHAGIADATVRVYSEAGQLIETASTDANGAYTIEGLAPGSYKLEFSAAGYQTQFYSAKSTLEAADAVPVTAGATHESIDAALSAADGAIAGTVTNATTHDPIAGARVAAYEGSAVVGTATTDASGKYTISGLAPGEYAIEFAPPVAEEGNYARQFFTGKHTLGEAEKVTVTAGAAAAANAAMLPPAPKSTALPTISGQAREGQTLSESHGSWQPAGSVSAISYAYQWLRCDAQAKSCTMISAATSQTYTLTAADAGHAIEVEETATNAGGSGHAISAATAVVTALPVEKHGGEGAGKGSGGSTTTTTTTSTTTTTTTPLPAPASEPPSEAASPAVDPASGQITLDFDFPEAGHVVATAKVQEGASIARVMASEARKKGKKCKLGFVKKRGRCVNNAPVLFGSTELDVSAAGSYKITIKPMGKALAALRKGKTLLVTTTLVFTPAGTSDQITKVITTRVHMQKKGKKMGKGGHGKGKRK